MASFSSVLLIAYALTTSIVSAVPTSDSISARETPVRAGVNITVFNDASCGHDHIFELLDHNLTYGVMMPLPFAAQSYNLSRFLSSEERLDWSAPYAPNAKPPGGMIPKGCGTYLQTTNPDSNGNPLHDDTCYLITGGATCVNIWTTENPPIYNTATGYDSVGEVQND